MKKYIIGLLILIIGLLVLFAPFGFAHVCLPKPDGSFMKCHWMGEAVRMLGGLITALGLIFLLCSGRYSVCRYRYCRLFDITGNNGYRYMQKCKDGL